MVFVREGRKSGTPLPFDRYMGRGRSRRQAINTRLRHGLALAIVGVLSFALPGAAAAYTTAPGYQAGDYATGFPEKAANAWGPIGIAFDRSDNLYVADAADGNVYRLQPGGGTASAATRLTPSPIPGGITGLVVSSAGEVYLARYNTGDVVQLDPGTGQVIRTIASVPCATGLAIDPASGDLFVSENDCGSTIYRVSDYSTGPGTVSSYASAPGVDGLAFDQSGSLYAESEGHVLRISGTASSSPGAISNLATVPHADGLAFGAHGSGQPPFLVANRNDGTVTRVDFGQGSPAESDIFSGGSRGDFAAVDSHGCLYITQSASVVRIGGTGQACAFEPTTPGPAPRVALAVTASKRGGGSSAKACVRIQALSLRIRQQGRVRLRSATVYVNGRSVKQLKGARVTATFVLTHLPKSSFTVKIVAITTRGRQLVTTKHYANCAKPAQPKCTGTRHVTVKVPQRHGDPAVLVTVYVNARRVKVVRGHSITRVGLTGVPRRTFTVKLVTRYARGKSVTTSSSFAGC
jgi:sugar lactone lactonase YvrE